MISGTQASFFSPQIKVYTKHWCLSQTHKCNNASESQQCTGHILNMIIFNIYMLIGFIIIQKNHPLTNSTRDISENTETTFNSLFHHADLCLIF